MYTHSKKGNKNIVNRSYTSQVKLYPSTRILCNKRTTSFISKGLLITPPTGATWLANNNTCKATKNQTHIKNQRYTYFALGPQQNMFIKTHKEVPPRRFSHLRRDSASSDWQSDCPFIAALYEQASRAIILYLNSENLKTRTNRLSIPPRLWESSKITTVLTLNERVHITYTKCKTDLVARHTIWWRHTCHFKTDIFFKLHTMPATNKLFIFVETIKCQR